MSQQASSDSGKGNRGLFSGHIGFILAVAGSAVGLGNIWRFPYLAAKYGGGIFLLVYIILMLTFGYALIVAETSLGRKTRLSPVGAYRAFRTDEEHPLPGVRRLGERRRAHAHPAILLPHRRLDHQIPL